MKDKDLLAQLEGYVTAAAQLLNLDLDGVHTASVALQLSRTLVMARQLEAFPMATEDEMAETFCPASFPSPVDDQGGV